MEDNLHRRFANIYIGWGHKYNAYNYSPPNMPPIQDQYKIGPEIMEIRDPTVAEEEEYRKLIAPPVSAMSNYLSNISRRERIYIFLHFFRFIKLI